MRRLVAATVAVALLVTGCGSPAEKEPDRSLAVIKGVADRLDVPFGKFDPGEAVMLGLPESFDAVFFSQFVENYRRVFINRWSAALKQRGLVVGAPGDLTFLAGGKGDSPETKTTQCPSYNDNRQQVSPATTSIFYCVLDKMQEPVELEVASEPFYQGTLWVTRDALTGIAAKAKATQFSDLPRERQVAQALFVHLTALWADALTRQLHAYAQAKWNMRLPTMMQVGPALLFSYCVAGAMAVAVFGEKNIVSDAVSIVYGQQNRSPQADYATAAWYGHDHSTLGACIGTYWSQSNT